ncbi:MAG: DUF2778 domain-containing protein, partial [Hydrococcus sp. C42_A2020_068]|nr:DUF2778 domain-containing protein [Hydrococcus sp. C42_A2020_068]
GARYYDPRVSTWVSTDPALPKYIDRKEGNSVFQPMTLSLYAYVNFNPLVLSDPTGEEVKALFNNRTKQLYIIDTDTGKDMTVRAESGLLGNTNENDSFKGPLPQGNYDILDYGGEKNQFRLEAKDENYGDDKQEGTGRSQFRLHGPGTSLGCISACKTKSEWNTTAKSIRDTKTSTTQVKSKSILGKLFNSKESIKKFGELKVSDGNFQKEMQKMKAEVQKNLSKSKDDN